VARVLAIVYAVFGLSAFLVYAVSGADFLTLPFGVVAPLFHLNISFHLARSNNVPYNILLGIAAVVSYALTGSITGVAGTLCFNFIAKHTGGIDAKFVSVAHEQADGSA
jgi:hypothetical protein